MADAKDQGIISVKHDGDDYEALYKSAIRKSAFLRTALCVLAVWFFGSWIAEAILGGSSLLDSITVLVMELFFFVLICLRTGTLGLPLLWGRLSCKKILLIASIAAIAEVCIMDTVLYCRGGKSFLHFFVQDEFHINNIISSGDTFLFGPVVEEFFYHGYLQTILQPLTPIGSVAATAAFFAFSHTALPFPEAKFLIFLEYLPGSIIGAIIRQRTKSMAACILEHILYNIFTHFDPIKFFVSRSLLGF